MIKVCAKCKVEKELTCFGKSKQSKNGYKSYCKECRSKEEKQRVVSNGGTNRIDRSLETSELKICTKCKQLHKRADFNHNSWCRFCINKQNRVYAEMQGVKEKFIPIVNTDSKQCCRCKKIKPLSEYSPSQRGRLGKAPYCKPCASKYRIEKESKEVRRDKTRTYRSKNREWWRSLHRINQFNRRAKIENLSDGTVTPDFVKSIYQQENCYYCNSFVEENKRTLEHKQPLNKDGKHSVTNIVMACFSCNSTKRDMTEDEFINYFKNNNQCQLVQK